MNQDFVEMLSALFGADAEFLIVGAHALAVHARPRATGDLDVWVRPTPENAERVWSALTEFGAPLDQLEPRELTLPNFVFQIGLPPRRIDLLTAITGVDWDVAWTNRVEVDVAGLRIPVLGREELIANKRATGRAQDLVDLEELETNESDA